MSKTQLQTNNAKLSALITELQGKAAGGGSGGSVETCTVSIIGQRGGSSSARIFGYFGSKVIDGKVKTEYKPYADTGDGSVASVSLSNMICGTSLIVLVDGTYDFYLITADNCEYVGRSNTGHSILAAAVFKLPETSGNVTITMNYTD